MYCVFGLQFRRFSDLYRWGEGKQNYTFALRKNYREWGRGVQVHFFCINCSNLLNVNFQSIESK